MASEEKNLQEQSEEKLEKKKHRGIPEALFLVIFYYLSSVSRNFREDVIGVFSPRESFFCMRLTSLLEMIFSTKITLTLSTNYDLTESDEPFRFVYPSHTGRC